MNRGYVKLEFLKEAGNLTIKTTNKFSIITIVNWHIYQSSEVENDQQNDQQIANKWPHTKTKEHKKKTAAEISLKISTLKSRYSNPDLLERAIIALASTRKNNRIADSVVLAQLEKWAAYPPAQVEAAIKTYLDKGYADQGKSEAYLMGVIRNVKTSTTTAPAVPEWY
jgi:hypothetical protein